METQQQQTSERQASEEIDVVRLLARGVIAIRNNFKVLLLAFLVGTAAGTIFYMTYPKRYSSRMIIQSDILTEAYAASIINDLEQSLNERNSREISKKLGMTQDEASQVFSIDIESIKDTKVNEKKEELSNAFQVTVQISDNAILPKLQSGILSFLSSYDYVKIRENQRRNYYKGMIAKVDKELCALDSMRRALFAHKSKSFGVMLIDPSNIYKMAVALNKEKIGYQNRLELVSSVQLVGGFTVYDTPSFPNMPLSLAGGASLGIIIVSIVLGYKALLVVVGLSQKKLEQS